MMKKTFLALSLLMLLSPQVLAVNVQQMKQRLNNSTQTPEQVLLATSQNIICKTDKKPICYCEAVIIDTEKVFAITKVTRPEANKTYYILYQHKDNKWNPLYSRTMDLLSLKKWKDDHVMIPDPVAKRLISKLQALR